MSDQSEKNKKKSYLFYQYLLRFKSYKSKTKIGEKNESK